MELEDLRDLLARTDDQIAALRARVRGVIWEAEEESHTARSHDGLAVAVVSGNGQEVLDLSLPQGLGDFGRPAWALADDLDAACRAIVEAVNSARHSAAVAGIDKLQQEFPDAFDLINDLRA